MFYLDAHPSRVRSDPMRLYVKPDHRAVRTPLEILADTIHPFRTTVRVMGGLFAKAARREAW